MPRDTADKSTWSRLERSSDPVQLYEKM